jgi:hypothetical protein
MVHIKIKNKRKSGNPEIVNANPIMARASGGKLFQPHFRLQKKTLRKAEKKIKKCCSSDDDGEIFILKASEVNTRRRGGAGGGKRGKIRLSALFFMAVNGDRA